jgi:hypothetical protein
MTADIEYRHLTSNVVEKLSVIPKLEPVDRWTDRISYIIREVYVENALK